MIAGNPAAIGAPAIADHSPHGVPTDRGLLTLASLKLPQACLPDSHRPLSAEDAAAIAKALQAGSLDKLRCCTECHHAGATQSSSPRLIAIADQNCQLCHRG